MSFLVYNNVNNLIKLNPIIPEKNINLSVNNYKDIKKVLKFHQKELNEIKSRKNKKYI